ncbi:MAG: hypothetical protein GF308_07500 [Candidatus Heimdallarchaeota archaeon]|nr:hypothetical protein [Candidatus Heimdallarchaeota archaeon]
MNDQTPFADRDKNKPSDPFSCRSLVLHIVKERAPLFKPIRSQVKEQLQKEPPILEQALLEKGWLLSYDPSLVYSNQALQELQPTLEELRQKYPAAEPLPSERVAILRDFAQTFWLLWSWYTDCPPDSEEARLVGALLLGFMGTVLVRKVLVDRVVDKEKNFSVSELFPVPELPREVRRTTLEEEPSFTALVYALLHHALKLPPIIPLLLLEADKIRRKYAFVLFDKQRFLQYLGYYENKEKFNRDYGGQSGQIYTQRTEDGEVFTRDLESVELPMGVIKDMWYPPDPWVDYGGFLAPHELLRSEIKIICWDFIYYTTTEFHPKLHPLDQIQWYAHLLTAELVWLSGETDLRKLSKQLVVGYRYSPSWRSSGRHTVYDKTIPFALFLLGCLGVQTAEAEELLIEELQLYRKVEFQRGYELGDDTSVYERRAITLALGMLQSEKSVPLLISTFEYDYLVAPTACWSLALIGTEEAVTALRKARYGIDIYWPPYCEEWRGEGPITEAATGALDWLPVSIDDVTLLINLVNNEYLNVEIDQHYFFYWFPKLSEQMIPILLDQVRQLQTSDQLRDNYAVLLVSISILKPRAIPELYNLFQQQPQLLDRLIFDYFADVFGEYLWNISEHKEIEAARRALDAEMEKTNRPMYSYDGYREFLAKKHPELEHPEEQCSFYLKARDCILASLQGKKEPKQSTGKS